MVPYATVTDLANYLHTDPPVGAPRLLERASRRVRELLRTAVYAVDSDGMPTDAAVVEAVMEATCEQVDWMAETGDTGSGAADQWQNVKIGSVALTRAGVSAGGAGTPSSSRYAPNAVSRLIEAGLLPGTVYH